MYCTSNIFFANFLTIVIDKILNRYLAIIDYYSDHVLGIKHTYIHIKLKTVCLLTGKTIELSVSSLCLTVLFLLHLGLFLTGSTVVCFEMFMENL